MCDVASIEQECSVAKMTETRDLCFAELSVGDEDADAHAEASSLSTCDGPLSVKTMLYGGYVVSKPSFLLGGGLMRAKGRFLASADRIACNAFRAY